MATLGTSGTGQTFNVGGSFGQIATTVTMPDPGGYITAIRVWLTSNGSSSTGDRLYLWRNNGTSGQPSWWFIRSSATFGPPPSSLTGPTSATSFTVDGRWTYSDGYIPGGTTFYIGSNVSTGIYTAYAQSGGSTVLGNTQDGDFLYHGVASGIGTLAAQVDYNPAAPKITSTNVSGAAVGQSVVITGYAFTGATGVTIGGVSASYTVNSNTQITATVPAGAGQSGIYVTNANGNSNTVAFQVYGIHLYDGTVWQPSGIIKVYDGAAWQIAIGKVYDGAAWQQGQ